MISPEGAASILGRYKDDADKAVQFPLDCQALATAQCIYANQLEKMGVVDEIIWEQAETDAKSKETFQSFPVLKARLHSFLQRSLTRLSSLSEAELISHRYSKYRALGTYSEVPEVDKRLAIIKVTFSCHATHNDNAASQYYRSVIILFFKPQIGRMRTRRKVTRNDPQELT